jgi:hypothetical protein
MNSLPCTFPSSRRFGASRKTTSSYDTAVYHSLWMRVYSGQGKPPQNPNLLTLNMPSFQQRVHCNKVILYQKYQFSGLFKQNDRVFTPTNRNIATLLGY